MAKIDLKFLDDSDDSFIKVFADESYSTGRTVIQIYSEKPHDEDGVCVHLDIPTAIKFAKTLRTEINRAKEVTNG